MYIHLGADIAVNLKYVVAIMDLETTSTSPITKEFLHNASLEKCVINVSEEDLPKSYVITEENKVRKVYVSPISSLTLNKRANQFLKLIKEL